jgi:hypothetical protein
MKNVISLFVILLCLGISIKSRAAEPDTLKPRFTAVRIDSTMNLSGKLDDPLWLRSLPVDLTYEILPRENTRVRQKTTVMALYDDENLYFGFRCYDTLPSGIRAHFSDRDKIFSDDYVIVSIDTYNDYQKAYEFAVNPYGIQGDLLMMGAGNEDPSYDMVWYSAASRNAEGWTAEIAIPFKSLSFSSDKTQEWTITILRCVPRDSRYLLNWTRLDRNNPSWMAQGGILEGLEGIRSGKSLELLPYTMIQQTGERSDRGDPSSSLDRSSAKARIGGGLTYSPGPNISVNAVLNPDFSQIESDAEQISVNTTFAIYYPEKRPFFMSGMDLLQTPMFYSRTINNPLYATKVNGKAGKLSYIGLAAYDRNFAITVPGEEESSTLYTEKNSYAAVGRIRYDMGKENFIGVLWLSRNFSDAHNYLSGLDWNFKFWKNWYWQGELFLTNTRELNDTILFASDRELGSTGHDAGFNGEQYFGSGMHLALIRAGRNYSFSIVQNNFSPTYQTYNGMFPEVGLKQSYMTHGYTFHLNRKIIQRIRISNSFQLGYNFDHVFKEFVIQPAVNIYMIGQTFIGSTYLASNRERFRDVFFTGINREILSFQSIPLKGVSISVSAQFGKFIYRSASPEMGHGYDVSSSLELKPFSRLKTSFMWSTSSLSSVNNDEEFYNGHIFRNITTFQFTRKLFLRQITQYNTFSKVFNIYPLISYKFNAFTMFCAGMTQDYLDYDQEDYRFRTTGYQYFVKLQYLFSL